MNDFLYDYFWNASDEPDETESDESADQKKSTRIETTPNPHTTPAETSSS